MKFILIILQLLQLLSLSLLVVDDNDMSKSAGLNCKYLHFLQGTQVGMYITDKIMTKQLPLVEHLQPAKCKQVRL